MRTGPLTTPRIALLIATAAMAAGVARADILINPSGWRFPNIITSAKEAIKVSDRTPAIPGKETINRGYRKSDGTFFMTYEIEGKIFGVEVDEDGKPPFEFSIMDADGDGKFETKIRNTPGNKDHAYVPQWVIDYYFSVHPEVTPGPAGTPIAPSLKAPPARPAATAPAAKKPAVPLPPKERPNP
jgi:hypothetical protein